MLRKIRCTRKPRASKKIKGIGKKLAIYVPREDEYVLEELNRIIDTQTKLGFRTSLSFELVKTLKAGLAVAGVNIDKVKADWHVKIGKS